MSRSTHDDPHRQLAPELEESFGDPSESEGPLSGPGLPRSPQENLNLGHACLRTECWPGGVGTDVSSQRLAGLRPARAPCKLSTVHHARPAHPAEARFTSNDYEFIEPGRD